MNDWSLILNDSVGSIQVRANANQTKRDRSCLAICEQRF